MEKPFLEQIQALETDDFKGRRRASRLYNILVQAGIDSVDSLRRYLDAHRNEAYLPGTGEQAGQLLCKLLSQHGSPCELVFKRGSGMQRPIVRIRFLNED